MGGADVSVITDISGINKNPASIAFLQVPEIYYMHKSTLAEFNTEYVAVGTPLGLFFKRSDSLPKNLRFIRKIDTGLSVLVWHTADIDEYGNESNIPIGTISAQDMLISWGLGYNLRGYRLGLNTKVVSRQLGDFNASTIAFDMGVLKGYEVFRPLPYQKRYNLKVGMSIQNLGPGLSFNTETENLPLAFRPGVTYGIFGNRNHIVDLSLGLQQIIKESMSLQMGIEYNAFEYFFFRFGREFGADGAGLTLGTGGQYTFRKVNYRLDYAFWSRANGVPDNHTFSAMAQLRFLKVTQKRRVTSLGIIEGASDKKKKKLRRK